MKYITNNTAIVLFIGGKPLRIEKTDKNYPKILQVFQLPEDEQEDAVVDILSYVLEPEKIINETEGFQISEDGVITYKGEILPNAFATKVRSIINDGLPLGHFEKFWENLSKNPSYHVVNETGFFEFLEYRELPLTEDGCFLAYRGVKDDYWSVSGDLRTKVLQGIVNDSGQIYNGIGEVIEVQRNGVCDDRNVHCARASLHIGSLQYAKDWASRVVVVKVNPADVVSVPNDCESQKCRVCKYEVIGDFKREIIASVVDENGGDFIDDLNTERNDFIHRVDAYLTRKMNDGWGEVTLRQIQNSMSPKYPSKQEVLDALYELDFYWENGDNGVVTVFLS